LANCYSLPNELTSDLLDRQHIDVKKPTCVGF
jgi:hypothetical protein